MVSHRRGQKARPKSLAEHRAQGFGEHAAASLEALEFFWPEVDFQASLSAAAAHHRGHGEGHISQAIAAPLHRGDRQDPLGVERDRSDSSGRKSR